MKLLEFIKTYRETNERETINPTEGLRKEKNKNLNASHYKHFFASFFSFFLF